MIGRAGRIVGRSSATQGLVGKSAGGGAGMMPRSSGGMSAAQGRAAEMDWARGVTRSTDTSTSDALMRMLERGM